MRVKILLMAAAVMIAVSAAPKQSEAGTMGCLLGAAAGGFGGAQFGKGSGQLAATAAGTLLGCGAGSAIQDRDQQYAPAPRYRYQQQPRRQFRSRYNEYRYRQPQQQVIYVQAAPQPALQPVQRACPYSREFQLPGTIIVGGREVQAYGQGCSHDGGRTWNITPAQ